MNTLFKVAIHLTVVMITIHKTNNKPIKIIFRPSHSKRSFKRCRQHTDWYHIDADLLINFRSANTKHTTHTFYYI